MVKILIVLKELSKGGMEKVMIKIANHLDRKLFEPTIAYIIDGSYRKLVRGDVKLVQLKAKNPVNLVLEIDRLSKELCSELLFISWPKLLVMLYFLNSVRKTEIPILMRIPNTLSVQIQKQFVIGKRLITQLTSKSLELPRKIVALNEEMKDDLVKNFHVQTDKLTVIPNPIDMEEVAQKSREYCPLDLSRVNIVSAGRLEYEKGFDVLIRSFALVKKRIPHARLTILGTGSLRVELERLVERLNLGDSVTFAGWVENPYPYYRNADLFVLSSRFEGFPNVLLEAMACGAKVVATDCPTGPRQIIGADERFGWLAPVDDVEKLSEKILEALNSKPKPNDRLTEFDLQNIVKKYEQIINSVLFN